MGTRFQFPEKAMKLLVDYYVDGITKSMAFAKFPDIGAKNRDLTRRDRDHEGFSPELSTNIAAGTSYRKEELQKIIASQKGIGQPNLAWNRFFPYSEYYTHQRPTWFSSVRMHSIRQNNVEFPYNEEGLKNHHLTDGANYITITGKEYSGISPVWDWQKIPGTTVLQKSELPHFDHIVKQGKSKHVGAVSNGQVGAASMHLISVHDPLEAKKAWFYFTDGYVCLGAGVTTTSTLPVATTINQSLLHGEVKYKKENQILTLAKGNRSLDHIKWIYHDNIYYFMGDDNVVNLKNDVAYGNWRSINHQEWATFDTVRKNVFMAWFDHPGSKRISQYAYKVVPGSIKNNTEAEQQAAALNILQNNELVQAVEDAKHHIVEAVFYTPSTLQTKTGLGMIKANDPALIMIEGTKGITLHVSDPLRNKKSITLRVDGKHLFNDAAVHSKWDSQQNKTFIEITMPSGLDLGKTVSIKESL